MLSPGRLLLFCFAGEGDVDRELFGVMEKFLFSASEVHVTSAPGVTEQSHSLRYV